MTEGKESPVDWDAGTWEGSRRAQLERNQRLTVRERLVGLEDLTETSDRLAGIAAGVPALHELAVPPGRHAVELRGTHPTPLASYLKALGVLRLVAEQKDPLVRGCWRRDHFILVSELDEAALESFILEDYRPTPMLAPWGGRSGFYPGSSEASARAALEDVVASDDMRLRTFRDGIAAVRALLDRHTIEEKPTSDEGKLALLRACRSELPDDMLAWLDACYVLTSDSRSFPPLLGTGGNEGSASYVANFAQAVIACVAGRAFDDAARAALFGRPAPATFGKQASGQFAPSAVGGPNATAGFEAHGSLNPWDLILCLEGALLFAVAATARLGERGASVMSAPFTVRPSGSGSGALALADETTTRAEIWMPIWSRTIGLEELQAILGEGRVQFGRQRATRARDGLDFARAVATLGVERGITEFQRYAVVQRAGKNMIAVPVDRMRVSRRTSADLIDQLDPWLGSFRSLVRRKTAPGRLQSLGRRLDDGLFALTRVAGRDPAAVQAVLQLLGEVQSYLARRPDAREACSPVPSLGVEWITSANDGSAAFHIAAALAGLHATKGSKGSDRVRWVLPMRPYFAPVSPSNKDRRWHWVDSTRRVAWGEGTLESNLLSVLQRRLLDADGEGLPDKPLAAAATASLEHVSLFLRGGVPLSDVSALLPGLVLCRIPRLDEIAWRGGGVPLDFALLKPLFCTHRQLRRARLLDSDRSLPLLPEIVRWIARGDVNDALDLAHRRLRIAGMAPQIRKPRASTPGDRLIVALMTPISTADLRRTCRWFKEFKEPNSVHTHVLEAVTQEA